MSTQRTGKGQEQDKNRTGGVRPGHHKAACASVCGECAWPVPPYLVGPLEPTSNSGVSVFGTAGPPAPRRHPGHPTTGNEMHAWDT